MYLVLHLCDDGYNFQDQFRPWYNCRKDKNNKYFPQAIKIILN